MVVRPRKGERSSDLSSKNTEDVTASAKPPRVDSGLSGLPPMCECMKSGVSSKVKIEEEAPEEKERSKSGCDTTLDAVPIEYRVGVPRPSPRDGFQPVIFHKSIFT